MKLTLVDHLDQAALKYGDRPAWRHVDRTATYAELRATSRGIARSLVSSGTEPGDRVAFLMHNRPEILEVLFGVATAGAVTVPVNFRFVAREVEYVVRDATPRVLVFEEAFTELVEKVRGALGGSVQLVCLGDCPDWAVPYEEWSRPAPDFAGPPITAETPFFIGYTSGTTGAPKGALVTHGGLIRNNLAAMLEYGAPSRPDDVFLTLMPMFHSNSTWFGTCAVMAGATNVIAEHGHFDPEKLLAWIERYGVTHTSVVPTMLKLVADLGPERIADFDTSSLEWFLCGSAPLPLALKRQIESFFPAKFSEGYGATETGIVSSLRLGDPDEKKASVGRPLIGTVVSIRDGLGRELPAGEVGEVWALGETTLLTEYWNNPEATAKAFDADGWLSVGDMGFLDEDGFLHLSDRKNDMIISGGENVYPSEIEGVLLAHPAVAEVAVVPAPHPKWGETVKAVLALRPGATVTEQELEEHCRAQLAAYKIPREYVLVEALPKSPTGKILRRLARDLEPHQA